MSPPDLEIRPLAAVPIADAVDLLRLCMGDGSRRSESFWRWKHVENVFGESPGAAAYAGGTLVGVRVFMRWEWSSEERTFRAVRAVDTATHPEWRRQGLFSRLTKAVLGEVDGEGVDFVFNTPNAHSRQGYLKMGWRDVGKLPLLVRPAGPSQWLSLFKGKEDRGGAAASGSPVAGLLDAPGLTEFLARLGAGERRFHTPRTVGFLRWRYGLAPGLGYRALWSLGESGTGALIVLRPSDRGGLRAQLLSEVLVSSDASGRAAAAALLRRVAAAGVHHYSVAHAAAGTPERRALLRAGFLPVPRGGPHLTARLLGRGTPSPHPFSPRSWRLGLGDLEVF